MPNGIQVDFKYDLFGHRVEKVVSTTTVTTTRYVYSGEAIIGILDGSNNVVSRVIHGPGVDEPLMIRSGTNEAYLYADGLGSIIAVADANATLQETVEYQAYGKAIYKDAVSGSTATVSYTGNPYGYTGREPDAETGLYYYRARYYDAEAGRFIQPDPIGFKGGDTNLYAYVGNRPVGFIDPTGLYTEVIIWGPSGYGRSSFGHVSIIINGISYSYGPGGMDIRPAQEYVDKNAFRKGFGYVLNISDSDEKWFADFLSGYGKSYERISNNCGSPVLQGLKKMGYLDQGESAILPATLGDLLIASGLVDFYNFYYFDLNNTRAHALKILREKEMSK